MHWGVWLNAGCAHGSGPRLNTLLAPRAFQFRQRSHHRLIPNLRRAVSLPGGALSVAWLIDGRPTRTTRCIPDGVTACAYVPPPNGLINRRFWPVPLRLYDIRLESLKVRLCSGLVIPR